MTPAGIISAIIIGAIIGVLGRLVVRGKQNISILVTILVGIVAALLGTWLAGLVGVQTTDGIDWIELLFQVVLAAIGVAIVAGSGRRRRLTRTHDESGPPAGGPLSSCRDAGPARAGQTMGAAEAAGTVRTTAGESVTEKDVAVPRAAAEPPGLTEPMRRARPRGAATWAAAG